MPIKWTETEIPLKALKDYDRNPRRMSKAQFQHLVKSLKEDGYHQRLVVNRDFTIIGGHQRKKALQEAGFKPTDKIPVLMPSEMLDKEEFKRINVRDNLPFGEFDFDMLTADFDIDELLEWGMPEEWLPTIEEVPEEGLTDDDAVPALQKEATTKLGDLYILGNHRILCGDSTSIDAVERLMDGVKADITFTSPPYNVGCLGYDNGKDKYKGKSDNKNQEEYLDFLFSFTNICMTISKFIFINNQFLSNNRTALAKYIGHYSNELKEVFPWIKNTAPPNVNKGVFTNRFEFILCLEKNNPIRGFPVEWQGKYHNLIEGSTAANENVTDGSHSATMPLYVPLWFIDRLPFIESIYDPFGGSGTTLIACEKTNRKCFMMELSPNYCDVIVKRWEDFTGKTAELMP